MQPPVHLQWTPSPEDPNYQHNVDAALGIVNLGPAPMGQGRWELPDEAYVVLSQVSAKVVPPAWAPELSYRWTRLVSLREWSIKKSPDGSKWTVALKRKRGIPTPDDDTGSANFYNTTPSIAEHKIYFSDSSGMAMDLSIGSSALAIGDCLVSKKDFTYIVDYMANSGNGIQWFRGGQISVGQVLRATRKATTGVNASTDWTGLENSFKVRKVNPTITEDEVRALVGGSLPIEIDSNANN